MSKVFKKLMVSMMIWVVLTINVYADNKELNITYVTSPFNMPSIIMNKKGFLQEELNKFNVKVNFLEITSGAQQTQAMAAGKIDIASVLGSSSAILAKANNAPIEIIGAYARSPKAYVIMVKNPTIKSVADLKGKKIAGPKGTVLNQLLAAALIDKGLALKDVEYINMDIPAARAALLSDKIDAATLAGANAIEAEKAGASILTTGENLINPTTVIAARSVWVQENPEIMQAYLQAHLKAIDFIKNNLKEALKITAEDQKITFEDAEKQYPLYDFTPFLSKDDIKNLNEDQDFMIEAKMLQKDKKINIDKDLISPKVFTK